MALAHNVFTAFCYQIPPVMVHLFYRLMTTRHESYDANFDWMSLPTFGPGSRRREKTTGYQHTSFDKVRSDPPGLQSWLEPFVSGGPSYRSQRASSGQSCPLLPRICIVVSCVTGSRVRRKPKP